MAKDKKDKAIKVKHDEKNNRFLVYLDGEEAGFSEYLLKKKKTIRVFNRTVVDPEFRGQGLSKALIKSSLEDTKKAGLKFRAQCSAYENFLQKNKEYTDFLV